MKLELTESELTSIIQQAFEHYKSKPFGGALFDLTEHGILVRFYDAGAKPKQADEVDERRQQRNDEDEDQRRLQESQRQTLAAITLGGLSGGFGGFGGGSSGGGGATGQW